MKRCEGHTKVWEVWGGPSPSTLSSVALSVTPLSAPPPPFRFVECLSRFPHIFSVEGPRGAGGRVSLSPSLDTAESRTTAVAGERGGGLWGLRDPEGQGGA